MIISREMWDDITRRLRSREFSARALEDRVGKLEVRTCRTDEPEVGHPDDGPCGCEESVRLRAEVAMQAAEMGRLRDELDSLRKANRRLMIRSGPALKAPIKRGKV